MKPGFRCPLLQVGFHEDKLVKKALVQRRLNEIVNRLNKTQVSRHGSIEARGLLCSAGPEQAATVVIERCSCLIPALPAVDCATSPPLICCGAAPSPHLPLLPAGGAVPGPGC